MGHHTKNQAFTIVELLIVIIVIAILATITIVSYRGITKSAYNTQVVSGVKSYYEALTTYNLVKHKYPATQREVDGEHIAMTCLGQGYKDGTCGSVTGVQVYEDPLFNSQMLDFLKSATSPVSSVMLPVPGESYVGAVYGIDTTSASSTGYGRVIEYAMHGQNADCGIPDAYAYSSSASATACEILIEEVDF
jgi:prepilin-type N-terminal cleavage/methylation domain-containing protein